MSTSPQATGSTSHSTKLPKLVLKKFSDDPKIWQEWWDVEKFNHLRSLVEGAAHSTIAGLTTAVVAEEKIKLIDHMLH